MRCEVCQLGYFPNAAGQCVAVANAIAGCMLYTNATSCALCLTGDSYQASGNGTCSRIVTAASSMRLLAALLSVLLVLFIA